jgi:hypothetical protein
VQIITAPLLKEASQAHKKAIATGVSSIEMLAGRTVLFFPSTLRYQIFNNPVKKGRVKVVKAKVVLEKPRLESVRLRV